MLVWNLYQSDTDPYPVSKVHTSCICVRIEGKMKKQIIQIFHNMINKEVNPDQQSGQEVSDIPAVRNVSEKIMDRKNFEKIVNDMFRGGQETGCMLIGGLDRFKDINEIYGHDTGDAVLRSAVDILSAHFKECACIGRIDGDKFAFWISDLSGDDADYIRRQAGRVNDRLLHPGKELPPVSVSVGVAFYEDGDDCRSLGKRASKMLYRVKENGRCGCEISTDI